MNVITRKLRERRIARGERPLDTAARPMQHQLHAAAISTIRG